MCLFFVNSEFYGIVLRNIQVFSNVLQNFRNLFLFDFKLTKPRILEQKLDYPSKLSHLRATFKFVKTVALFCDMFPQVFHYIFQQKFPRIPVTFCVTQVVKISSISYIKYWKAVFAIISHPT